VVHVGIGIASQKYGYSEAGLQSGAQFARNGEREILFRGRGVPCTGIHSSVSRIENYNARLALTTSCVDRVRPGRGSRFDGRWRFGSTRQALPHEIDEEDLISFGRRDANVPDLLGSFNNNLGSTVGIVIRNRTNQSIAVFHLLAQRCEWIP